MDKETYEQCVENFKMSIDMYSFHIIAYNKTLDYIKDKTPEFITTSPDWTYMGSDIGYCDKFNKFTCVKIDKDSNKLYVSKYMFDMYHANMCSEFDFFQKVTEPTKFLKEGTFV